MKLTENHREHVQEILGRYPEKRAALMPLLYLAQDVYGGWLPPEAIQEVAAVTELEPTDVYAVSAFYSLYYHEPMGKYVLRFCTDMPCALVGADELFATLCAKLGVHDHGTTADGLFTVQSAVCLAACGLAPVIQVNRQFFENLTEQQLDQLIASVRANGLPPDGPGLRFQPRDGA